MLRWACLTFLAALVTASPQQEGTSKANPAGIEQTKLRGSGHVSVQEANPCATCPVCVSLIYGRQVGTSRDMCGPCALGAQTSWPCNAEPAQCTCADGLAPVPVPTPAPTDPPSGIRSWFSHEDFDEFFPHVNSPPCTGANFFTYEAFLHAADHFPTFANTGNRTLDKIELAAWFGQTSHETTGGWPTAPGGPLAWGYCWRQEMGCGSCSQYCQMDNQEYPCVGGESYQGRGPIQLSWNYNYGAFSEFMFGDKHVLLEDAAKLANDPVLSFQSAIWFWMTPQAPKPSCHDVMTGAWQPTPEDRLQGRVPGFGMTTNIINGGLECNVPTGADVENRVAFYERYAGMLGVSVDKGTSYCHATVPYR